ncbi:MAG: hypothetical protein DI568_15225 [Sphingomonas sp.]|nr:MAG: hypothetical protein DI568_15225 [Sphingomonas sp.]
MPALSVEQVRTLIDRMVPQVAARIDATDGFDLTDAGITAFLMQAPFHIPGFMAEILTADGSRTPAEVERTSTFVSTIQMLEILAATRAALPADFNFHAEFAAELLLHSTKLQARAAVIAAACSAETGTLN